MVLWELLTREELFADTAYMNEIEQFVLSGGRPAFCASVSIPTTALYRGVIASCWQQEAVRRAHWDEVLNRLEELDVTDYEQNFGTTYFQQIKENYAKNLNLKKLKKAQEDEAERRLKEREEADMLKRKQNEESRNERMKEMLSQRYYSKILPPELHPTLKFYFALQNFDQTVRDNASTLGALTDSLVFTAQDEEFCRLMKSSPPSQMLQPDPALGRPISARTLDDEDAAIKISKKKVVQEIANTYFGIYPFVYLFVCLFTCLLVCLYVCLFMFDVVCLFVCLFVLRAMLIDQVWPVE
jgi:hypothetical protein